MNRYCRTCGTGMAALPSDHLGLACPSCHSDDIGDPRVHRIDFDAIVRLAAVLREHWSYAQLCHLQNELTGLYMQRPEQWTIIMMDVKTAVATAMQETGN